MFSSVGCLGLVHPFSQHFLLSGSGPITLCNTCSFIHINSHSTLSQPSPAQGYSAFSSPSAVNFSWPSLPPLFPSQHLALQSPQCLLTVHFWYFILNSGLSIGSAAESIPCQVCFISVTTWAPCPCLASAWQLSSLVCLLLIFRSIL